MKAAKDHLIAALVGICVLSAAANAQETVNYPDGPVDFIVGFSPGGGTDTVARITAEALGKQWGKATVVDNRAGAGGAIAAELVAKARPDGKTLLFDSASFTLRPALETDLPFDVTKDFVPVSLVSAAPYVLVVNPNVKANSVEELVKLAKERPGELTYASAGIGSSLHFAAELFKSLAQVDIRHIPYQGAAGIPDLIAGRVDMAFAGLPQALPQIQAGKLRALAVTTLEPSEQLPDVPTMQQAGVEGYEMQSWYGLFAPAATPQPIFHKIAEDVVAAAKDPEVQRKLASQGLEARGTSPDDFAAYVTTEIEKWKGIVKQAGITAQ
ncbi:Bug family tripartite tricarboxylate transporter substrate binding protein [Pseudochelatococcus sp. B33]